MFEDGTIMTWKDILDEDSTDWMYDFVWVLAGAMTLYLLLSGHCLLTFVELCIFTVIGMRKL